MANKNTTSEKLFIGLGIITVISGILLALERHNLIGLSGSVVGVWLIIQNVKQLKEKKKAQ